MENFSISKRLNNIGFLNSNMLKIIALTSMTLDHIGVLLFPEFTFLRIIGRLAFPIFAFMIAEGFRHTKSLKKYFLSIFLLGLICQIIYFISEGSLYQSVLITFSLSLINMYLFHKTISQKGYIWLFGVVFGMTYCIAELFPILLSSYNFAIDYGFWGIMLAVAVSLSKDKFKRLILFSVATIILAAVCQGIQWWSLLSIPVIAMYNEQRGRLNIKWLFYVYYPLHLALIQLIYMYCK